MQKAEWLPSTVELLEQDLTDSLATHEAIMAGLRRLSRTIKEAPSKLALDRIALREPVCA